MSLTQINNNLYKEPYILQQSQQKKMLLEWALKERKVLCDKRAITLKDTKITDDTIRKRIDPDKKLNKDEWKFCRACWYLHNLTEEQLRKKLNTKYDGIARCLLGYEVIVKEIQSVIDTNKPFEKERYYFVKNLRLVWPHHFVFRVCWFVSYCIFIYICLYFYFFTQTYVKDRWKNRKVNEVMKEEFMSFTDEYLELACRLERIKGQYK